MKIIVSSQNPVKVESTLEGFQSVFPKDKFDIEGVSVASGVADQPMSEEETIQGALNRVNNAYKEYNDADYWVGIEGGIQRINGDMMTYAWIYIKSNDLIGKARSTSFFLPPQVAKLVDEGKELGDADDIVFGRSNSKQQNGAAGLLTGDLITRTSLYVSTVIMALIPFKNMDLYKQ